MSELTRNAIVGLATIVAVVALAVLLMFFGELQLFASPQYEVTVHLNRAGGLRPGSQVELNGVTVGLVRDIILHDDPEHPVRAETEIDDRYRIPKDVEVRVERSLLAGTAVLQFNSPSVRDEPAEYLARDGQAALYGIQKTIVEEFTDELDQRAEPVFQALERFEDLSATYITLGDNLNRLVAPPADGEAAGEGPNGYDRNVYTAVVKMNEALDDAHEAIRLANRWLEDEQLRRDVREAVTNAGRLIEKGTETFENFTRLTEQIEGHTEDLARRIVPVADELTETLADLRRLARLANDGEGTIGRLLNSPALHDSLQDSVDRLEQALIEMQLFIQKSRAEGVPLRF